MKTARNPDDVHAPQGVYSHQIEITGGERLLAMAGQVGARLDGSVPDDAYEQLALAFENVERNLRAANMDIADVVKITYYLVGDIDVTRLREMVRARFQAHRPTSTLLYVAGLASPAYRVEIEVWAAAPEGSSAD